MNKDQINQMACASGLLHLHKNTRFGPPDDVIERFAQAIRNEALERAAVVADSYYLHMRQYTTDVPDIASDIRNLKEQQ